MVEKTCTKCGILKSLDEYFGDKRATDGRESCCRVCRLAANRLYQKMYPEKNTARLWKKNHPERVRLYYRIRDRKLRATERGKLNKNISYSVYFSLKKKKGNRHWEDIVGYTIDQLMKHLEKQFTQGMTWENYGDWHVDHKIPQAAFNFQTSEDIDFKRCWALKNLRPMWAKENISKGAKIERPFQPSLTIGG
jgi:nucleoid DNA-binding protein